MPYADPNDPRSAEVKRAWRQRNKDKVNAAAKRWRDANPGRNAEACARWRKENPEAYKKAMKRDTQRRAKLRKEDPDYALSVAAMQAAIRARKGLKGPQKNKRLPAWLAGTVPKVKGEARVHLAGVE